MGWGPEVRRLYQVVRLCFNNYSVNEAYGVEFFNFKNISGLMGRSSYFGFLWVNRWFSRNENKLPHFCDRTR